MTRIRVLFLGDIVGAAGLAIFQKHIKRLREQYRADAIIVNGENSAGSGRGITPAVMRLFKEQGVNVVTSGNHIWQKPEIINYIAQHTDLVRPINFPAATRFERDRIMAVDGKTTAALDYGAEAWLAEISITHAPTARATDALGKYGARPEEGDDFRERIYHVWTIAKQIWTLYRRSSDPSRLSLRHPNRKEKSL